jgi:O-acetyl-ADP-ribose deacetylase (regulator of RNase III)
MIEIITGDLLDAKEKYILHQTNCVSKGSAGGIARSIFDKYPYADCYLGRKENSDPGTIDIRGDGSNNRFVINMHSQVYPGGPKFPLSDLDGARIREKYFHKCFLKVARIPNLESVALPWRIGCGLGGGDWNHYLQQIEIFSNYVEINYGVKVKIYRRENDE